MEAKILEVTFDHTLSREEQVVTLCKKLNNRISCYAEPNHILTKRGPYIIITHAFIASLSTVLVPGVAALKHFSFTFSALKNVPTE